MNAAHAACASSSGAPQWNQIDWATCERNVRRLQARIVKATREGRHGRVNALQWLLTHSFSGRALAVKRVTGNAGKETLGWIAQSGAPQRPRHRLSDRFDGAATSRNHFGACTSRKPTGNCGRLVSRRCTIGRCRRCICSRSIRSRRPRRIATRTASGRCVRRRMRSSSVLSCSLARALLCGCWKATSSAASIISSHDWMLNSIPMDKAVLRGWLKAGYVEKRTLFATDEGTPQGGVISPALANMTLDGLDRVLQQTFPRKDLGQRRGKYNPKVHLVRYADDFIITGTSEEVLKNEVRPLVEQFLAVRGLALSSEKTGMTHIDEGFDFLGQHLRKYHGKLLVTPSRQNVHACLQKVRAIIRPNCAVAQADLIHALNRVILGWVMYHRHIVATRTFRKVDHVLWHCLWRWARRRHHLSTYSTSHTRENNRGGMCSAILNNIPWRVITHG